METQKLNLLEFMRPNKGSFNMPVARYNYNWRI